MNSGHNYLWYIELYSESHSVYMTCVCVCVCVSSDGSVHLYNVYMHSQIFIL